MGFFDNNKPTAEQELYMLKGRVAATAEYIRKYPYSPDKDILLAMLGSDPDQKAKDHEEPAADPEPKKENAFTPHEGDDW